MDVQKLKNLNHSLISIEHYAAMVLMPKDIAILIDSTSALRRFKDRLLQNWFGDVDIDTLSGRHGEAKDLASFRCD